MKKFVFSLLAIASFSFASATEIKTGEPIKEKVVTEITVAKNETVNETVNETEELKTVTCYVSDGEGGWIQHQYSCFFCWGGAKNGCIAEAASENGLVL